ncbi:S24 family peptidase [Orrella sp. 11846]|uniref:S24 family peptidase n=1 Tax=Orrella sp. 11846 TaxID=3409913 RepID=UPI003B58FA5F
MERAGYDVRRLSDALNMSYQAVKKVVDGKSSAFSAVNNAKASRILEIESDWLALGDSEPPGDVIKPSQQDTQVVPYGYVRLEHLPYEPSMGKGRIQNAEHVIQHLDVLETFIRQKVGTVNPDRIKLITGVGTSMEPAINDQDIVFVDIEHKWIDAPGYYVIDVGGLLLLKKAMILSTGTLILRSENTKEYPDEERHDLRKAAETITVCGKVLAWWTLKNG